jgi:hypothetical protein
MRTDGMTMKVMTLAVLMCTAVQVSADALERKYAPYSEYAMTRDSEIALAKSAAPKRISDRATIKVLTPNGFEIAQQGDNGFLCLVMRSWSAAPDVATSYYAALRAPICFNPIAARTVAPAEELRTKLGLEGKPPATIAQEVAVRYGNGELPRMDTVAFAYMWSADQDTGPGFGAWHPHMMIYAPYYENAMLGGNEVGGHAAPFVVGDRTPYSIVLVTVDKSLAIKARE